MEGFAWILTINNIIIYLGGIFMWFKKSIENYNRSQKDIVYGAENKTLTIPIGNKDDLIELIMESADNIQNINIRPVEWNNIKVTINGCNVDKEIYKYINIKMYKKYKFLRLIRDTDEVYCVEYVNIEG